MNVRRVCPSSRRRFLGGTLAAMAAASPLARSIVAAQRQSGPFVLVHGAWHGGWCWRRVADRLTAKGRYVVAPTLTGVGERSHQASESISLSTHIEDVVNEIKWKDLEAVVLGDPRQERVPERAAPERPHRRGFHDGGRKGCGDEPAVVGVV